MNPRVSIVIPTHNRANIVADTLKTLDALLDDPTWEVVVVDDGSTDNTPEMLASWVGGARDRRVVTQPNRGAIAARNRGAQEARGEILVFIDDDIRPPPDFLSRHVSLVEAGPDRWATGPVEDVAPPEASPWGAYRRRVVGLWQAELPDKRTTGGTWVAAGNLSVPRESFLAVGGYDESLTMGGEERDLVLRAREQGVQLVFDPDLVAPHHDSFLTFEAFLSRQERYSCSVVRIWRRHGVESGYDARVRANLPPRLGEDSPASILKKLLRRALASPWGFAG